MSKRSRQAELTEFISENLPDFKSMIDRFAEAPEQPSSIMIHQDAFAADYQESEYILLGKAIKYAGMFGANLTIVSRTEIGD